MKHFINCFKNLSEERNRLVMGLARGRLLDIGCGKENYIQNHRLNSIGIDKYDDFPIEETFDTVSMVASFNYMSRDEQNNYLDLIRRVLTPYGRLIITCVTPLGSRLKSWDGEKERGIGYKEIVRRVEEFGYRWVYHKRFNFWLNNLLMFYK